MIGGAGGLAGSGWTIGRGRERGVELWLGRGMQREALHLHKVHLVDASRVDIRVMCNSIRLEIPLQLLRLKTSIYGVSL